MKYKTTDLAVIIPTKDRPVQVKRHLQSLVDQKCKLGRVIVVVSGQDIKDIVLNFKDILPVEYYESKPGQIRQRNMGISKLDDKTKLVATMDDDVTYFEGAIKEVIDYWNSLDLETAGVGFNVTNCPAHKHTWFKYIMGFSVPSAGKILRSGWITPITNISENISAEYLNGGTTVWRQEILKNNLNEVINNPWAVIEDIMFSYPIGKKYPLYVCSKSKVDIEDIIIDDLPNKFYFNRGRAFYLQSLYFIKKNPELSVFYFLINKMNHCIWMILDSIVSLNKNNYYFGSGILSGFFDSVKFLLRIEKINSYKSRCVDYITD